MDPDLVRQQAEAELEQRNGVPVLAKNAPPPELPPQEAPFAAKSAVPTFPVAIYVPEAAMPAEPPSWGLHLQAVFSSGALAGLTALAAAVWGSQHGLSGDEQAWFSCGAAALMAMIYGIVLSVNGNNFIPAGSNS